MLDKQRIEIDALNDNIDYIKELVNRGISEERLDKEDIEYLKNTKLNISEILKIHDLDRSLYNKYNSLLKSINNAIVKQENAEIVKKDNIEVKVKRDIEIDNNKDIKANTEIVIEKSNLDSLVGDNYWLNKDLMLPSEYLEQKSEVIEKLKGKKEIDKFTIYNELGGIVNKLTAFVLCFIILCTNSLLGSMNVDGIEQINIILNSLKAITYMLVCMEMTVLAIGTVLDAIYLNLPFSRTALAKLVFDDKGHERVVNMVSKEATLALIIANENNNSNDKGDIDQVERDKTR